MKNAITFFLGLTLLLGCASGPTGSTPKLLNTKLDPSVNGPVIHQTDMGVYIGEVKNGKPHGQGTWYLINRMLYTGVWKEGALEGTGTAIHLVENTLSHGEFKNGHLYGKGYLFHGGSGFYGTFEEDIPAGMGKCVTEESIHECHSFPSE